MRISSTFFAPGFRIRAAFSTALLLCVVFSVTPTAHALTLKIASIAPDGTRWMKELRKGAGEISERTDGRVRIKFYPGGVMGSPVSVLRKMRIGQLHGGAFTGSTLKSVYNNTQIYNAPLLFQSYEEVDVVRPVIDQAIRDGLQEGGLTVVGISEGGFAYIMCRQPLRAIDDLEGHKVWLPQGDVVTGAVFQSIGVSPVPLSIADVYTGLQTGLVDTIAGIPTGTIAFQWHTKVTHLTDVPLMFLIGILAIDNRTFNRISPADQAVVHEVMQTVFKRLDGLNRTDNQQAKQALAGQGIEFVHPSPEEMQRWHEIADITTSNLVQQGEFSGALIKKINVMLDDYRNHKVANVKE